MTVKVAILISLGMGVDFYIDQEDMMGFHRKGEYWPIGFATKYRIGKLIENIGRLMTHAKDANGGNNPESLIKDAR